MAIHNMKYDFPEVSWDQEIIHSYFPYSINSWEEGVMSGANVIKLFLPVIYEFS